MSRGERVQCARPGCDEWFTKGTHNQRYHDDECCRLATNARIMENYYETRDRLQGKTRLCRKCQKTQLSRYNESTVCTSCKNNQAVNANNAVLAMLSNAAITA